MGVYTPDSNRVVHHTYADMTARQIVRPVHLVQYDQGLPIIAVKLYNDGLEYTIPTNATVNIRCGKVDGNFVYNPALGWDSAMHTVYFEVTKQMTALAGEINPIVEIELNNKIVSSGAIAVQIDFNPVQEQSIRSTTEYLTAKQYAEQAVDAAAKAASSASQASGYASTANSIANAAASSASGAASSANAANTSAVNAKSYADSAASSKNAAASSASNASASATNAKKSETAAANSASLAQAAYEEILGADVGKFGSQLANEHSVLQPIYDSSGQNICDSSGREIQGRIIFADESEVVSLRQQVSYLDTFIRSVISRLGYVTDHALLDSDYKGL
ncbi:BppU family phage baseplate upper protein [Agathobacter rectalis]|jgi:hypothetical protein|uniref:DUF2479 domain-containing protein n=1 Tax=Agathobacter rectalis TaxID=39491 RepID=A0A413DNJ2_9FIRM|nr:BppU family phage baseplate upper protein [Agathobacter rectalis]RGW88001.1 DUF2479 domain-containing protein [Agathobacter rectalis]